MTFNGVLIPDEWVPTGEPSIAKKEANQKIAKSLLKRLAAKSPCKLDLPLKHYEKIFQAVNPAMFPFMLEAQKKRFRKDLETYFYLSAAEIEAELHYNRYLLIDDISESMKQCQQFIEQLDTDRKKSEFTGLEEEMKPVFGIAIFAWISEQAQAFNKAKIETISELISPVNERRLYWIWGGSLLHAVLEIFSKHIFNYDLAQQETSAPQYGLGLLSWVLYYARFGIELSLLLKYTISDPWVGEEGLESSWHERLTEKWNDRKFNLLNDSVWATCNIICFYWLVGPGVKGQSGDLLTLVLLGFDLALSYWQYAEEKQQHEAKVASFQFELKRLENEFIVTSDESKNAGLFAQIEALKQDIYQEKLDWQYTQLGHMNNLFTAAAFIISFALLAMPFIPLTAHAFLVFSLIGSVACFALTIAYNVVDCGIAYMKSADSLDRVEKKRDGLYEKIKGMGEGNEKKLLYLHIKALEAASEYEQAMVRYRSINLARTFIIDAFTPLAVFAMSAFVPLTLLMSPAAAGFLILGLAFALTQMSKLAVDKLCLPKEAEKATFDEKEYRLFCRQVQNKTSKVASSETSTDKSCFDFSFFKFTNDEKAYSRLFMELGAPV